MEPEWFEDIITFVAIGAIVVVTAMLIVLFFDLRAWIKRKLVGRPPLMPLASMIDPAATTRVHLKDGKVFSGVRLKGVMDQEAAGSAGLPHPLTNMAYFERADGGRLWIDAAAIRVIEAMPAPAREDA